MANSKRTISVALASMLTATAMLSGSAMAVTAKKPAAKKPVAKKPVAKKPVAKKPVAVKIVPAKVTVVDGGADEYQLNDNMEVVVKAANTPQKVQYRVVTVIGNTKKDLYKTKDFYGPAVNGKAETTLKLKAFANGKGTFNVYARAVGSKKAFDSSVVAGRFVVQTRPEETPTPEVTATPTPTATATPFVLVVDSVKSMDKDGVTIVVKDIKEDQKAVALEVKDPAGKVIETLPTDIKAGATEVKFAFKAAQTLVEGTYKVGAKEFSVVTPFSVASVDSTKSVSNIVVTFTKDVDATSVVTAGTESDTVKLYDAKGTLVKIQTRLSDDKRNLTLAGSFENTGKYKLVVDGVKDKTGKLAEKFEKADVIVTDTTKPEIVSANATSVSTVEVVFSEPVKLTNAKFQLNGKDVVVTADESRMLTENKATVILTTDRLSKTTPNTFKVTGVTDFASITAADKEFTNLLVKDDMKAPELTEASIKTLNTLELKMSKILAPASVIKDNFKVTVAGAAFTVADATLSSDRSTVTLTLSSNFGPSALAKDAVKIAYNNLVDANDNKMTAEVTYAFTPAALPGATSERMDAVITNQLKDFKDTVILGNNAIVQATILDKDGKPAQNKTVCLTLNEMTTSSTSYFEVKGSPVVTTDANGVATFAVATRRVVKATDIAEVALVKYKAEVIGTNLKAEGTIKFAAVGVNQTFTSTTSINRINTNDMLGHTTQYLSGRVVSAVGGSDMAVQFTAKPKLYLPTGVVREQYVQNVGIKSGVMHPNKDWHDNGVEIDVPAGLKYATLNFNKLQVSKYSKLHIEFYDTAWNPIGGNIVKDGEIDQANFGIQIPVQQKMGEIVYVWLETPSEVNTKLNGGFDIKDVTGVYDTLYVDTTAVDLPEASIKWDKNDVRLSEVKYFSKNNAGSIADPDAPADLAALLSGAKANGGYYDSTFTYSYQVPIFPQTGNAVIVGKDANGVVQQYFVVPTVNKLVGLSYKNVNVIKDNTAATYVTRDEALNSTGTVTQTGDTVTANSEIVGTTSLRGVVVAPTLGSDVFNATNNTVYTSVQWNPRKLPSNKKALALVGQRITVKAQLTDANGNPVAMSGAPITWLRSNPTGQEAITQLTGLAGTNATLVSIQNATDAYGQAVLQLSSGDYHALVQGVTAVSTDGRYKVSLKIGNDVATSTDLYWIAAGLDYFPTLNALDHDNLKFPAYSTAQTVGTNPSIAAGSNYEYEYLLKGSNAFLAAYSIRIAGVPVNYSLATGSVGNIASVSGTNMFTGTSNLAGITQVVGSVGQPTSEVKFTLTDAYDNATVFTSVGEGLPSTYSNVTLPIQWTAIGQAAAFIAPMGTTVAKSNNATTVFLKVTDAFGNPIQNKKVTYTISGVGNKNGTIPATATTTDVNGVIPVLVTNDAGPSNQTVISATVEGMTTGVSTTLNWIDAQGPAFALMNIGLNRAGANDVVDLTFSEPIEPSSAQLGQFNVTYDGKYVAVKDMKIVDNKVSLTLADSNAKLPTDGKDVRVTIGKFTVPTGTNSGVVYTLTDKFGRAIDGPVLPVVAPFALTTAPASYDISVSYDTAKAELRIKALSGGAPLAAGQVIRLVSSEPKLFNGLVNAAYNVNEGPVSDGVLDLTTVATPDGVYVFKLTTAPQVISTVSAHYQGITTQNFVNRLTADITGPVLQSAKLTVPGANATTWDEVNDVITLTFNEDVIIDPAMDTEPLTAGVQLDQAGVNKLLGSAVVFTAPADRVTATVSGNTITLKLAAVLTTVLNTNADVDVANSGITDMAGNVKLDGPVTLLP